MTGLGFGRCKHLGDHGNSGRVFRTREIRDFLHRAQGHNSILVCICEFCSSTSSRVLDVFCDDAEPGRIGHIVCSRVTFVFIGLCRTLVNIPMSQLRIIACRKLLTRDCGIPVMPVFCNDLARITYN